MQTPAFQPALEELVETKPSEVIETKEPEKPVSPPYVKEKEHQKPPSKIKTEYIIAIIGAIATLIAALIGILPQFLKPAPAPTASVTSTRVVGKTPTSILIASTPSITPRPSLTSTEDFTLIPTFKIKSMPKKKTNGLEFTFSIDVPSEYTQGVSEFQWSVWQGTWIKSGDSSGGGGNFSKLKYASGWKKVDDEMLIFVFTVLDPYPDNVQPLLLAFRICGDDSRVNCRTVSDQFSYWSSY